MILVDAAGPIARILLDRPTARNALHADGWSGLADAVSAVASSRARVVIVGSAVPGAFCAGADLAEVATLAERPDARAGFRLRMRAALDPLRALAIPSIAAVDGGCFGAGVALAVACDIVLAGAEARFAVTPARLGIAYPKEDVDRIRVAVGRAQAARLLLGAGTIDAAEAARIGLAQQAVPDARAEAEVLAGAIAGNAPGSVVTLKAMLGDTAAEWDAIFDAAFGGAALREGLAAFRERRPPAF